MIEGAPIAPSKELVRPSAITIIPEEFGFRHHGIDKGHLRGLVQAVRTTNGKLAPLLLWREMDSNGAISGRLILLDGEHRLAAYRSARKGTPGVDQAVPAIVVSCDRTEAKLLALAANAKDALPLTAPERADGAWRLVRDGNAKLSIARIVKASGVSSRTVSYMRGRAKELSAAEITGAWWRDRQGTLRDFDGEEPLTDKAREEEIIRIANIIRKAGGQWPSRDPELIAEALRVAFGFPLRGICEFLFGTDDEFYDQPINTQTGTDTADPERDF